ncbi:MAG: DUF4350 domain-containing protein [Sinobacteraceae bacterium]|nr:DUF4350 domain-containing protein [Nevskiaceae bacterium]
MRERLTTLACALGAALLLGTLLLRGDALPARRAALPTSLEQAPDGLLGLKSWLQQEGVGTFSLRQRFGALSANAALHPRGNLLIVTLPAVTNFRPEEAVALDRWVREGNTVLVLAALRDRPRWAQFPLAMASDLELITELTLTPSGEAVVEARAPRHSAAGSTARGGRAARDRKGAQLAGLGAELSQPEESTLVPNRAHAYFSGVTGALAFSDYAPVRYTLGIPRDGFALALGHETGSAEDAFWIRPHGEGTIVVSGFGSLFSNRALGKADNGRLFANLIAASVGPDGKVVFDDEHQGLSDDYDPARFYRDPRLHATLGVIIAVWLTWVLGATQLQTRRVRAAAPREAELVRTTGLYLARVLRPAAAARRLLDQFLERLGSATGRAPAESAAMWEWLESHPRLGHGEARQLREWHAAAHGNRRVPLVRLHNLIVHTERQIAQ